MTGKTFGTVKNFCHLLKIPSHILERANPREGPLSGEQGTAYEDTKEGQSKKVTFPYMRYQVGVLELDVGPRKA